MYFRPLAVVTAFSSLPAAPALLVVGAAAVVGATVAAGGAVAAAVGMAVLLAAGAVPHADRAADRASPIIPARMRKVVIALLKINAK
jgi:hypothetical protein